MCHGCTLSPANVYEGLFHVGVVESYFQQNYFRKWVQSSPLKCYTRTMNIKVERHESNYFSTIEYVLIDSTGTIKGAVYSYGDWSKRLAKQALDCLTSNHNVSRRNVKFVHV